MRYIPCDFVKSKQGPAHCNGPPLQNTLIPREYGLVTLVGLCLLNLRYFKAAKDLIHFPLLVK